MQIYSKLSQENPKDPTYLNYLGIALLQDGKLDDARKYFDRATKVNRRFSDAYNNLGATYYAEKQYKKAISQYQRSLSLKPDVASVYTNIGYAYFAEKQLPKAMEAFHKALDNRSSCLRRDRPCRSDSQLPLCRRPRSFQFYAG